MFWCFSKFKDGDPSTNSNGIGEETVAGIRKKRRAIDVLNEFETPDTKLLNTQQLQRLLILEQLKLVRSKQARIDSNPMFIYSSTNDDLDW
jgi:hypothetical protein